MTYMTMLVGFGLNSEGGTLQQRFPDNKVGICCVESAPKHGRGDRMSTSVQVARVFTL